MLVVVSGKPHIGIVRFCEFTFSSGVDELLECWDEEGTGGRGLGGGGGGGGRWLVR